ncbi:MAG: hypothetical protein ACE5M4_06440 [Anaerolineales bacterium]
MDRIRRLTSGRGVRRAVPVLLLGAVALTQLYLVWTGYGFRWLKAAWRTRDMPAETRSVRFMLGNRAAEYIELLKDYVPEDGKIVLPFGVGEFTQQSLLQFFLMPRAIPGCDCGSTVFEEMTKECVQCLRLEEHAVPAIGEFPPARAVEEDKIFIPNPTDTGWFHGVYLAKAPPSAAGEGLDDQVMPLVGVLVVDALLALGLFFLGSLVVGALVWEPGWEHLLPLGWPLGMGLLTFGVFLLGWAGADIVPATFAGAFVVLAGVLILIRYRRYGKVSPIPSLREALSGLGRVSTPGLLSLLAIAATILLVGVATAISVGRAYSTFDGIANWAIKGYAIAHESSIFAGINWGKHGLAYPQNIPLLIALFRVVDGDVLPGSKLVAPFLTASMLGGCFVSWRRAGVDQVPSGIATLGLATIPLFFFHATIGYVNVPFTAYLVLGTLFLGRGIVDSNRSSSTFGSLLLGFAAWTRPEGIGFGVVIILALMIGGWLLNRRPTVWASGLLPFLVVSGAWLTFSNQYVVGDEIGQLLREFLPAVQAGQIRTQPLSDLLAYVGIAFRAWRVWGLMAVAIPVLIAFGVAKIRPRNNAMAYLVGLAGLASLLFPGGMFYVAGYTPGYGMDFLGDSFDRAMFPAVALLFWSGVTMAFASRRARSGNEAEAKPEARLKLENSQ